MLNLNFHAAAMTLPGVPTWDQKPSGSVPLPQLYLLAGRRLAATWVEPVHALGRDDGAFREAVMAGAGACLALVAGQGRFETVLDVILDSAEQRQCRFLAAAGQFLAANAVRLARRLTGRRDVVELERTVRELARFVQAQVETEGGGHDC